jgi:hypothetical protein
MQHDQPQTLVTSEFAKTNKLQDWNSPAFYYGDLQNHVHTGECQ